MVNDAGSQVADSETSTDIGPARAAAAYVDDRGSHDIRDTGPVRSAIVVLAFVVHLVALISYTALLTATFSSYFGDGLPTGVLMLALIFLAGACVIIVAWDLPAIARSIVTVLTIAVFGIAGIAELVKRLDLPSGGSAIESVFATAPYICLFVFPFLVAGILLSSVRRRATDALTGSSLAEDGAAEGSPISRGAEDHQPVDVRQEVESARLAAPSVALVICALIIAAITFLVFVAPGLANLPEWFRVDWVIAVLCAVGTVAGLILLEKVSRLQLSPIQSALIRIAGYLILLCGIHVCILSAAMFVGFGAVGLGGVLLWAGALIGFSLAAIALPIFARIATPRAS